MTDPRNTDVPAAYAELLERLRAIATLSSASSALAWDQETMMPSAGAALRAEQLATLAKLVHDRATDERLGELITASEAVPALADDEATAANLREVRRDYERAVRLPGALVRELTATTSLSMEAWKAARARSDFAAFAPWLAKVLALTRERAQHLADGGEPYDALLDEYEPGMTAARLEPLFGELRGELTPLIRRAAESPRPPDEAVLRVAVPIARQQEFNREIADRMGFDFAAGRLDTSTHPFCEGIGPGDTRLTTRYRDDGWADALSSTMHEAGHGLYEQGLPKTRFRGQPLASSASFGAHESQSRLWENLVGRSRAFWRWAFPHAVATLGVALARFDEEWIYRASNTVRPTLIRVESDEATYNLHIMLRFDLERALLSGDLPVGDLPAAWNERVREDLKLEVPDDARGCLQDVHWSMGYIGYFPTYTLGNLYAAQLWSAMTAALPNLESQLAAGEFTPLLGWLRENVHRHGRRYPAEELFRRATGQPLRSDALIRYLGNKVEDVYGGGAAV
ncbi:MAG: carboxypeptidase M32 [Longimicrobiaceae bacterium]